MKRETVYRTILGVSPCFARIIISRPLNFASTSPHSKNLLAFGVKRLHCLHSEDWKGGYDGATDEAYNEVGCCTQVSMVKTGYIDDVVGVRYFTWRTP